ncbi:alpha/beta fold hydrolase [Sphingomonas sp.]|uniref:alpha/beta fold hydrolase n=1 Tax=Sphingomonas sp. TaxID=28214 RepID=UPI003B3BBF6E
MNRQSIGDLTLNVVQRGPAAGPRILLLHGFPESHAAWAEVADRLAARGRRVITPDLRGYGASDAPQGIAAYALDRLAQDIVALADANGVARFDLVGHDWGGIVAWAVAGRAPDRVRRLVAMAAPHPDVMGPAMRRHPRQIVRSLYIGFFQLPWLPEALLRARDYRLLRRSLAKTSRPGTFDAVKLATYVQSWRGRLTTMLNYYRALRVRRAPIGRIAMPSLILWGAGDRFLSVELARASAAMCDDARLMVRDDATHWLHHEEPAWVAETIAGFCEDGARPTAAA